MSNKFNVVFTWVKKADDLGPGKYAHQYWLELARNAVEIDHDLDGIPPLYDFSEDPTKRFTEPYMTLYTMDPFAADMSVNGENVTPPGAPGVECDPPTASWAWTQRRFYTTVNDATTVPGWATDSDSLVALFLATKIEQANTLDSTGVLAKFVNWYYNVYPNSKGFTITATATPAD